MGGAGLEMGEVRESSMRDRARTSLCYPGGSVAVGWRGLGGWWKGAVDVFVNFVS